MAAHMTPSGDRFRPMAALLVSLAAVIVVLAAVAASPSRHTDRSVVPDRLSTQPTVLGAVIVSTTLPAAPPASVAVITTVPGAVSQPTPTTRPRRSTDVTLIPPVSITRPDHHHFRGDHHHD